MAKKNRYISALPKPLLDDLVAGRWIPIVGAGFSRNAVVPFGPPLPLWAGLAKELAQDIPNFTYDNPLDAISAYEHEFTRAQLVERIVDLLRINDARPGEAHRAFCEMTFKNVITTNFDLLLERQYADLQRPCLPLIDEVQLSLANPYDGPTLIKFHGDVHHPDRLVLTESDYDTFLGQYPLLATYVSSLLISGTAVLLGYSLEDPDLRQLLAILKERLGTMRRPVYVILVSPEPSLTARFERRGVKVVALAGSRSSYGSILADLFIELQEYSREQVPTVSQPTEEHVSEGLLLPPEAGRFCFFAVPLRLLSWYKENFFPIVREHGLIPISADELVSPGGAALTKIDALMQRSAAVVVDVATSNTLYELGLARSYVPAKQLLVIREGGQSLPSDIQEVIILDRPRVPFGEAERLLDRFRNWISNIAPRIRQEARTEPERLLASGEHRAAVVAAFSLLEDALSKALSDDVSVRPLPFSRMLDIAFGRGLLGDDAGVIEQLKADYRLRSRIVHTAEPVSRTTARQIVERVISQLWLLESR
jgi:hypothetical protein